MGIADREGHRVRCADRLPLSWGTLRQTVEYAHRNDKMYQFALQLMRIGYMRGDDIPARRIVRAARIAWSAAMGNARDRLAATYAD